MAKQFLLVHYPQPDGRPKKVWPGIHQAILSGINVAVSVEGDEVRETNRRSKQVYKTAYEWGRRKGIPLLVCRKWAWFSKERVVWIIPL